MDQSQAQRLSEMRLPQWEIEGVVIVAQASRPQSVSQFDKQMRHPFNSVLLPEADDVIDDLPLKISSTRS